MSYVGSVAAADVERAEKESRAREAELRHVAGNEDLKELAAIDRAQPTLKEVVGAVGDERLKVEPDGSWTLDIVDEKGAAAFHDMVHPALMLEGDRGDKVNGYIPHINVRREDGVVVSIAAHHEDDVCRYSRTRPVRRRRSVTMRKFSDGLLWRALSGGRWECTGGCCMGRPLFPCANPTCRWCAA